MAETKHTPGPWRVMPPAKAQSQWIVATIEGDSVADCEPPGPWVKEETADANACLIAAAPELLAHAKTVAFHLRRGDHKEPRAVGQMIDALEAVIAKASPQS